MSKKPKVKKDILSEPDMDSINNENQKSTPISDPWYIVYTDVATGLLHCNTYTDLEAFKLAIIAILNSDVAGYLQLFQGKRLYLTTDDPPYLKVDSKLIPLTSDNSKGEINTTGWFSGTARLESEFINHDKTYGVIEESNDTSDATKFQLGW